MASFGNRVLAATLFAAALGLAFTGGSAKARAELSRGALVVNSGYAPIARLRSGTERLAIFIGSSTCGAAEEPRLTSGLRDLWSALAEDARERGMSFGTVGVALDWRSTDGIRFLQKLGWFDEVIAGRNWLNQGAFRFIFNDLPGSPAMPQVVLLERDVDPQQQTVRVSRERVVSRKIGVQEIVEWIDAVRRP